MKKSSFAFAVSLAVASVATTPAPAVTFGALATIYVASGVYDDGSGENAGHATTVTCTNVSGFLAHLRIVILGPAGNVEGSTISFPVGHGTTVAVSTHGTLSFNETNLLTGSRPRRSQRRIDAVGSVLQRHGRRRGVAVQRGGPAYGPHPRRPRHDRVARAAFLFSS